MVAGLALWGVATAGTGLAVDFLSILALRLLLGLGESVMCPTWQLLLARRTSEHERGRANGIIGAGQGLGPMLGTLLGGLTMARFGWRAMFVGLGVITLLWLWPWLAATRGLTVDRAEDGSDRPVSYAAILRQRAFWGAALGHFSINYAFYFVMAWLPNVFGEGRRILGVADGLDRCGDLRHLRDVHRGGGSGIGPVDPEGVSPTVVRKTFALTSAIGAATVIAGSAMVEPRTATWLLGAAGVFFGLSTPTMFAMTTTLAGPRAAGRWAGAQNVAGQIAGIAAPIVTGLIVDSSGSFSGAFVVSAAVLLVAIVSWGVVIQQVETVTWLEEPAPALSATASRV
jgi:MFS family permease